VKRNNSWLRVPILALGVLLAWRACIQIGRDQTAPDPGAEGPRLSREDRRIDRELAPDPAAATVPAREGLAAAIVIDVSGSMDRPTREDENGPKIATAKRAAMDLVDQFVSYANDHKTEPVLLAIYEFSDRDGQPDAREVVPMGPPDRERAAEAVARMRADGGTPIGSAMITAKRALDATGVSRRHLLVITDGENTTGYTPDDVTSAIGRRPESERPSIYFVAFDIEATRFNRVRDAGGLVLGAASGKELGTTLDALLRGKILVEKEK
jgi:Mg-chelatase subunit ChlD